jgi:hypothetical protein
LTRHTAEQQTQCLICHTWLTRTTQVESDIRKCTRSVCTPLLARVHHANCRSACAREPCVDLPTARRLYKHTPPCLAGRHRAVARPADVALQLSTHVHILVVCASTYILLLPTQNNMSHNDTKEILLLYILGRAHGHPLADLGFLSEYGSIPPILLPPHIQHVA